MFRRQFLSYRKSKTKKEKMMRDGSIKNMEISTDAVSEITNEEKYKGA